MDANELADLHKISNPWLTITEERLFQRPPQRHPAYAEVLSEPECFNLLRSETFGRIAYGELDPPRIHVIPVNYAIRGRSIVFSTGAGAKLHAVLHGAAVSFEVDSRDVRTGLGWSVLVCGSAEVVSDPTVGLGLSPPPSADGADRTYVVEVSPCSISGRRLQTMALSP